MQSPTGRKVKYVTIRLGPLFRRRYVVTALDNGNPCGGWNIILRRRRRGRLKSRRRRMEKEMCSRGIETRLSSGSRYFVELFLFTFRPTANILPDSTRHILYFRCSWLPIHLPPSRSRGDSWRRGSFDIEPQTIF